MKDSGVLRFLEKSSIEKDVQVLISNNMKWDRQVRAAAGKANSMLAISNNTFTYKSKDSENSLLHLSQTTSLVSLSNERYK